MKERVTREAAHDVVMKMSALSAHIRCHPKAVADSIILNGLGKCLEAGVAVVRHYIDGEEIEELRTYLGEFNGRYMGLMELFREHARGRCKGRENNDLEETESTL